MRSTGVLSNREKYDANVLVLGHGQLRSQKVSVAPAMESFAF